MKIWNLPRVEAVTFDQIEEPRPIALLTTTGAWEAVADRLSPLSIAWRGIVSEATVEAWSKLSAEIRGRTAPDHAELAIYAVGGGLAVDAAKYIAHENGMHLVSLPTALSVDAFFTWASGIRQDGCVRYLETQPPDQIVVDYEVLASAPPSLRAAGICDVLSIATGSWDWRFAESSGQNPPGMAYIPWVADAAEAILNGALDCAEAAGAGDREGLKQLLDCLAMEVQLCNQIGHSRPEEGSEHYFAYAVENALGKGLAHGDLVGPGIVTIANLQGQDHSRLQQALEACHIPLNKIPPEIVKRTLKDLPAYVRQHELPYGIAHELGMV